jgi:hypothetical protein
VSLQVAILKVLASHGSGRATLASLKRDIAILTASGADRHRSATLRNARAGPDEMETGSREESASK